MEATAAERLVRKWEDRRSIKNLMGKYVVSFLLKREPGMLEDFWADRPDICLGENDGWYLGPEGVRSYYDGLDRHTRKVRDLLAELYPEATAGKTPEELYGIGILEDRTITNCVLEIAGDGMTAKGMWCEFSSVTDVTEKGPLTNWIMGYYAVDFVLENGAWKLWHVLHPVMVNSPCSQNWSDSTVCFPDLPEFAPLAGEKRPGPTEEVELAHLYSVDRPFERSPRIPEPYETFEDTFSYGR